MPPWPDDDDVHVQFPQLFRPELWPAAHFRGYCRVRHLAVGRGEVAAGGQQEVASRNASQDFNISSTSFMWILLLFQSDLYFRLEPARSRGSPQGRTPWPLHQAAMPSVIFAGARVAENWRCPPAAAAARYMMNSSASPAVMPPATAGTCGPAHLIHHAQGDGADGRAGQPCKHIVEYRAAFSGQWPWPGTCYDEEAHRARRLAGKGHFGDVLRVGERASR